MSDFGVSIIISTWNRKKHLLALVHSIISQKIDYDSEVLIVDSQSPDSSEQFLYDNLKLPSNCRFDIKYFHTTNSLAAKRNYGAEKSKYPYLVFLDDDMLIPGLNFMTSIKECISTVDMDSVIVSGYVRFPPELLKTNYFKYKDLKHLWPDEVEDFSEVPSGKFIAMNCLIKRELYRRLSGYDEGFVYYGGEDRDFEFRSRDVGIKHILSKKMFAYHCEGFGSTHGFYKKIKKNSTHGFHEIKRKYGLQRFGKRITQAERIFVYLNKGVVRRLVSIAFIKISSFIILSILILLNRSPFIFVRLYDFYYFLAHIEGALNRGKSRREKFL